jgi:hypothetical protein
VITLRGGGSLVGLGWHIGAVLCCACIVLRAVFKMTNPDLR